MQKKPKGKISNTWHDCSIDVVLNDLKTLPEGLSQSEVEDRLSIYGSNCLPESVKRSAFKRLLLQCHNILIYLLLVSAAITSLLNHWLDTFFILAVVIVNAFIGFIQEGKAEKAMQAIRQMLAPQASVLRDGERRTIDGENLVPGDIVLLEAGDKVPADIRLIQTHGLQIQEAILTGESVPVEKHVKLVASMVGLGDRLCMAFSGTLVSSGQGKGVVVKTGSATEIGHISGMLKEVEPLVTPLVKQMAIFAKWITILILSLAVLILLVGYFIQNLDFSELFMAVVGLSVAAIPEGLPAVFTITLAVGVQAMVRCNAIVRRLPAIETIGSVSVICTDKTGTLTRNEMMVSSVITYDGVFTVKGIGYDPAGEMILDGSAVTPYNYPELRELALAAALCNDAVLYKHDDSWFVQGDPMEGALIAFANKVGLAVQDEQKLWKRTDTIPFDARHCFMATLNHDYKEHAFIFVKGAPERILAMCKVQRAKDGGTKPLDQDYWYTNADRTAQAGYRVLAIALKLVNPKQTILKYADLSESMIFLGMVGLIDPPRSEAAKAIAECRVAGIRVKMITGDHAGTAAAIARQVGLENPEKVLTGAELDSMDDFTLKEAVRDIDIFARTNPEHKLRLVMALQSYGMTVAMTGDGVNDAPALKRADVGIAMGKKGSEAAKEASELVLADDNFASIVAAVREGRTVYDNLKKVITWTLPTNAGEALTIIVALLFGMTLPVTSIQILWVNMITATTLGIALAFEPREESTMRRSPRARNESLLMGEIIWHIVLVSLLFLCGVFGIYFYAIEQGYSIDLARTLALNTLVVMEIFHLFFVRNIYGTSLTWKAVRGTKVIWATIAIITTAQFSVTYLPPLQKVFVTESVPFFDGLLIISIGIALFVIVEIEKQIRLHLRQKVNFAKSSASKCGQNPL